MNIKFFLIILLFLLFLIVEIIIIFLRNKKSNSEVIDEYIQNRKMKKGLKNIANNLREIADKLDKAVEEKDVDIINEE